MTTENSGSKSARRVLTVWTPEDKAFWVQQGQAIASRNLWISMPALFLAFAVWQLMSVIVVKLPQIGFTFTTNQLFWLVAVPALSGATLRIFYSFMVPIFGGRQMDRHFDRLPADSGHRARHRRAGPGHELHDDVDTRAACAGSAAAIFRRPWPTSIFSFRKSARDPRSA